MSHMECICNEHAGPGLSTSSTCIGHLWVFANLKAAEMEALAQAALRKTYKKGQVVFSRGTRPTRCFCSKRGG